MPTLIVILFLKYFIEQREEAYRRLGIEEHRAHHLLLNILPREIAAILKNEKRTFADQFEGANILFADLVGFTPLTAELARVEMVNLLNEIFSEFDALVEKYGLEKIRTIGDNYMVASRCHGRALITPRRWPGWRWICALIWKAARKPIGSG